MTQSNTVRRIDALVGKFFHTTEKCPCGISAVVWQGHILAAPSETHVLVQLYSWLFGEPHGQHFLSLDEFIDKKPVLYDTNDEMNFSYEHGTMRPHDCKSAS